MINATDAALLTMEAEIKEIEGLIQQAATEKKYFIEVKTPLTVYQNAQLKISGYQIKETEMIGGKIITISW